MKTKLLEHLFGVVVVTILLFALGTVLQRNKQSAVTETTRQTEIFGTLDFVDFNDEFDRALLEDVVNTFYPGQYDRNKEVIGAIAEIREEQLAKRLSSSHVAERLTLHKMAELAGMYLVFLVVYIVVIAVTYYGVQTLGVWRFCRNHRVSATTKRTPMQTIFMVIQRLGSLLATFVLFSPAYVIAYAIKTQLNTDTSVFMALLAVVSNGLLVVYANKFYAFLEAESRKGYVETAVVKNLNRSYDPHASDGIPLRWIFRVRKRFPGHVFDHIYRNASIQYLPTLKEQASFLISGLIIIEMALNIHGHLSYEMLRQLLYKNYDIVIASILLIFYTVKATEIFADTISHRIALQYDNKGM